MRSEQEIMDLILSVAKSDSRILAAYLKGSRTNPNVPKDVYQDFDLMYVVTETNSFRQDPAWLDAFGPRILTQEQDDDFGYGDRFGLRSNYQQLYSWLLLLEDGNRIDLGVETVEHMQQGCTRNKLFLPLLDKIGCLPKLPPPSDEDFHVKSPTASQFQGCCNEFFWSLCDVAKGIARNELPFAMTTYHTQTRPMLEQMLAWYVGCATDFSVSCGKSNKFFRRCLPPSLYQRYTKIYCDSDYEHMWQAIRTACGLFHDTANDVGAQLGFSYPQADEDGFFQYLAFIQRTLTRAKPGGKLSSPV